PSAGAALRQRRRLPIAALGFPARRQTGVWRSGSWRAPTPYFTRVGTMNRDGAIVGQPSRLSSRASRPRRILGRDAPAAGGTPAPLPRGSWKESPQVNSCAQWDREPQDWSADP